MAKDFNISNIVMGVFFNEKFHINNLFELLPCVIVSSSEFKDHSKIPFFGIPNCIISCQKEKGYRGYRAKNGFKNALCIDFQNDCKNIHIKITSNKFHITGAKSYEKGMEDSQKFLNIIKQVDLKWKNFFLLNKEDRFYLCKIAFDLLLFDNILLMYDCDEVFNRFQNINIILYKYSEILLDLIKFSYEYNTVEKFSEKMDSILKINPCEQYIFNEGSENKINKGIIYNGIYNYNYGFNLLLTEFSTRLSRNQQYIIGYHNFLTPGKMDISIHVLDDNNEPTEVLKYKKVPTHKFNINANGSVRQTSPTSTGEAYKYFLVVKEDILKIKNEIENEEQ